MSKHTLGEDDSKSGNVRQKLDTTEHIRLRALITNRQAALLIGDAGDTFTAVKHRTNAELDVSDLVRGAVERILTVAGSIDDVSSAFLLSIKAMSGEDIAAETAEEGFEFCLRLAVPHVFMSPFVGSGTQKLRQIMDSSKTIIRASEFLLPLSSERSLSITGTPSGIAAVLIEIGNEILPLKSRGETAMNNAYVPVSMFGRYGHPQSFRNIKSHDTMITPSNPYGIPPSSFSAPTQEGYGMQTDSASASMTAPQDTRAGAVRSTKDKMTQQIYIPNDMVGAIIGKSGSKINEIRNLSGSHIKINEPDPTRPNERLITVEGSGDQNQLALYMLYQRLESEKRRT